MPSEFVGRFLSSLTAESVRKWVIVGILIGVMAGIGSYILYFGIIFFTRVFLTGITGITLPPVGASAVGKPFSYPVYDRYLIPVSTTLGGLISGFLVYRFAPEAEGHGTDAAIDAFHNKDGRIRRRVPIIKTLASAITIGSGGSAGREGPTAQIAAGFGSFIADVFHFNDHDRRIATAAGIGAGIGSIFLAPLGGAILSTEILYKRDFEVEALIPSIIASITGYSIFGYYFHYRTLFDIPFLSTFSHPINLILYMIVGLLAGGLGIIYVKAFYTTTAAFRRLKPVSKYFRPAIGGLAVGIIAIYFPEVLGLGYGVTQQLLLGYLTLLPLSILIILIFIKIIATSFTIGSGGSGGVFAPGMVIGSLLGASIYDAFNPLFPTVTIAAVVIVSMISFFGGVSKAPISVIIIGSEMTGGFELFLPIMLATIIAYFITGDKYCIYSKQVATRRNSPAHFEEYSKPVLGTVTVFEGMNRNYRSVTPDDNIRIAVTRLRESRTKAVIVQDHGKLVGMVSYENVRDAELMPDALVRDIMDDKPLSVKVNDSIVTAMEILSKSSIGILAVVDDSGNVMGTMGFAEIADAYNRAIRKLKFQQTK